MSKQTEIFLERRRKTSRRIARSGAERYRVDCLTPARNRWVEIRGPGVGLRWMRDGSHDFFNFSELIKTIVQPGMSDLEKALAVYRFSNRYAHSFGIGFGSSEMSRFLNGFGYSFCWGQADFQHLLYEAAGLRARAPWLKGHSSVEVMIDGQWRMMDAFMRLLIPDLELEGLATGQMLSDHPEMWDHAREGSVIGHASDYWRVYGPGGTYEPWQDSAAMTLSLRRGESLRIGYDRRESWCVAPTEPPDFCNGEWEWKPVLDAEHIEKECDLCENVVVNRRSLCASDPGKASRIEYRFKSPYSFGSGLFSVQCAGGTALQVSISNDGRKSWSSLQNGGTDGLLSFDMTPLLSRHPLRPGDAASIPAEAMINDVVLRLEWMGPLVLKKPNFRFLVQIHNPSLPRLARGANRWTLLSTDKGASITHAWDEYPGLSVSNASPLEDEIVTIQAVVHNQGTQVARNIHVRFTQAGADLVLGQTVIPRIAPRGSATAQIEWLAKIAGDRAAVGQERSYVQTVIQAEIIGAEKPDDDAWTGVAEAVVTVRPRPQPKFNDHLTWSSDERHEEKLVLRAALIHLPQAPEILYQLDVPLAAVITPFIGHPDRGGLELAAPQRLQNIQPSEFAVAEWTLTTHSLPDAFDVWFQVQCDETIVSESRRILGMRRVRLK